MRPNHVRVPLWLLVAGGMAITVGVVVVALLRSADGIQSDVFATLTAPASSTVRGLEFIHVDGPPTGVAAGFQLGLIALLWGSVPAASAAAALRVGRRALRRPWRGPWANVFLAGFVFQVSSLAFTTLILVLLVWAAAFDTLLSAAESQEVLSWGMTLLVSALFSAWGLRSWRVLQLDAEAAHTPANLAGLR